MIDIEFWDEGNIIEVQLGDNKITEGIINNIPFSQNKKEDFKPYLVILINL